MRVRWPDRVRSHGDSQKREPSESISHARGVHLVELICQRLECRRKMVLLILSSLQSPTPRT